MKTIVKDHDFSDFVFANLYPAFMYPTVALIWMVGIFEVFRHRYYLFSGDYFGFFYETVYRFCFGVVCVVFITVIAIAVFSAMGSFRHSSRSEISYDDKSLEIKIRNSKRTYSWDEIRKIIVSKERLFICFKDNINFHLSRKGVSEEDWNGLLGAMAMRSKVDRNYFMFVNVLLSCVVLLWAVMGMLSFVSG